MIIAVCLILLGLGIVCAELIKSKKRKAARRRCAKEAMWEGIFEETDLRGEQ